MPLQSIIRTRGVAGSLFPARLVVFSALTLSSLAAEAQEVRWEHVPPPEGWWDTYVAFGLDVGPDGTLFVAGAGSGPGSTYALLRWPPGAVHWEPIAVIGGGGADDVIVTQEGYLVIQGLNRLRRSTNGGQTWTQVYDKGDPLTRLTEGPHAGTLFAGQDGYGRVTIRSDDSGATWHDVELPSGHLHCNTFLALPAPAHPNRVLAGCAWGIAVSDDGGLSFTPSELWMPGYTIGYSFTRLPDGPAFAMVGGGCCHGGIYRSHDGHEWELIFDAEAKSVLVVADEMLFILRRDGMVWRSSDAGEQWEALPPVYEGSGTFNLNGAAVGHDGRIWVTVRGAGLPAEQHGVYRTVDPVIIVSNEEGAEAGEVDFEVWPNPTRGSATVSFRLTEPSAVRIAVYDVLGRRVAMVYEGEPGAGAVEVPITGLDLPSGAYLVRLEVIDGAGSRHVVRRLTLAR